MFFFYGSLKFENIVVLFIFRNTCGMRYSVKLWNSLLEIQISKNWLINTYIRTKIFPTYMFHDHLKRFLEVPHWNRKINVEPSIFSRRLVKSFLLRKPNSTVSLNEILLLLQIERRARMAVDVVNTLMYISTVWPIWRAWTILTYQCKRTSTKMPAKTTSH